MDDSKPFRLLCTERKVDLPNGAVQMDSDKCTYYDNDAYNLRGKTITVHRSKYRKLLTKEGCNQLCLLG